MSAGDEQCKKRIRRRPLCQLQRNEVALHMMYRNGRTAPDEREPVGESAADHQGPDEPRSGGIRNRIGPLGIRLREGFRNQRQ